MTLIADIPNKNSGETTDRDYVKKYAKQMLKNALFTGTFQEKRFVEPLNSYRDVVTIADEEEDFLRNLKAVKKRIDDSLIKGPWVGITEPSTIGAPAGFNLWVALQEEVLGYHWYKVKTVEFLENEIRLKLDVVRPVKREFTPTRNVRTLEKVGQQEPLEFSNILNEMRDVARDNLLYFYRNIFTLPNIKDSVIFIALLIGTMVAAGFNIAQYLLEYLLKLIKEMSVFMKAMTPIINSLINLVGKVIFGFYHLIAILFQGKPQPQPVYNNYLTIDPRTPMPNSQRYIDRGLPYYPSRRSGVTITQLDN